MEGRWVEGGGTRDRRHCRGHGHWHGYGHGQSNVTLLLAWSQQRAIVTVMVIRGMVHRRGHADSLSNLPLARNQRLLWLSFLPGPRDIGSDHDGAFHDRGVTMTMIVTMPTALFFRPRPLLAS
eukprot:1662142-Rhodomonas_salina.1